MTTYIICIKFKSTPKLHEPFIVYRRYSKINKCKYANSFLSTSFNINIPLLYAEKHMEEIITSIGLYIIPQSWY